MINYSQKAISIIVREKGYYVEKITQFINQGDHSNNYSIPSDLKESYSDKEGWLSLSHMTSDISLFPLKE